MALKCILEHFFGQGAPKHSKTIVTVIVYSVLGIHAVSEHYRCVSILSRKK